MTLTPDRSTVLLPFRQPPSNDAPPLRVGVVLDRKNPSPWETALIAFLRQLPGLDVQVFALLGEAPAASRSLPWLTQRLYSASRAKFDPFGEITAAGTDPPGEALAEIAAAGRDVLIWLARKLDMNLATLSKHGGFSVRFGKQDRTLPFWDEVANGDTTVQTTISWHRSSLSKGKAVRKVETSTLPGLYPTLTAEEPVAAAIRGLANLCLELRGMDSASELELPTASSPSAPANWEAGRFVVGKLARSAQVRWSARGKKSVWRVALRPNTGASITDPEALDLKGFEYVPLPPGTSAIADPFLWDLEDRSYLFFEEIPVGSTRGRLGCVEVLGNGSFSEMKIVLDRPYHLSYPCIVADRGELFMLPETSEARRVDLYRFSNFPWDVELAATPVDGMRLVDTTPIFVEDRWYFFTTTPQPFMESLLFWSERLDGAWHLHPCNPISSSVRNSRSAGNLFWKNGRLYRPTQDCSVRYGYAIQVNEVLRLTPTEFEERPVNWIPPTWRSELLGTHTWNESPRFQTIDAIQITRE